LYITEIDLQHNSEESVMLIPSTSLSGNYLSGN
jgi:hypothetical protein